MKKTFIKTFLTLTLGFYLTNIFAQESTVSSGGNINGSSGSVCYTFGQVVCNSITGSNGTVSQGVQQPYEIFIITGINKIDKEMDLEVYPNPVSDLMNLKYTNYTNQNLAYKIYDAAGKLIETKNISGSQTLIDMCTFVSGTYFIKVFSANQELKVFKIIKQ